MAEANDFDDILGAQQDQIARDRYTLSKLIEERPEFKGCKTTFGVYQRIGVIGGDEGLRSFVADILFRQNKRPHPQFDPKLWIDRIQAAIKAGNEPDFRQVLADALLASGGDPEDLRPSAELESHRHRQVQSIRPPMMEDREPLGFGNE